MQDSMLDSDLKFRWAEWNGIKAKNIGSTTPLIQTLNTYEQRITRPKFDSYIPR